MKTTYFIISVTLMACLLRRSTTHELEQLTPRAASSRATAATRDSFGTQLQEESVYGEGKAAARRREVSLRAWSHHNTVLEG